MPTFEYTATKPVNSSAVDEVHYNANTKELAVDLHDEVYVYSGVPESRYEALVNAPSVGRTFREVKRDYGPSEYLGYVTDVDYEKSGVDAPDMGAVLTVGSARTAAVGTPKALTLAPNAVVTGTTERFDLAPAAPAASATRKHTVVFTANGAERKHTLNVASVDEAVAAVNEIAAMLDLAFKVKEVVVSFE